ncbi:hypothetical protein ADL03_40075 [Nocardia sp. NRRL S-836]|nr:hypothetical protein ADL03_40075 [Nocardia sp. NRRL S-836]
MMYPVTAASAAVTTDAAMVEATPSTMNTKTIPREITSRKPSTRTTMVRPRDDLAERNTMPWCS